MATNPMPSRGQQDGQLQVSSTQAIPVDGNADLSTNAINMQMTSPKFGAGTPLEFRVQITTAFGKSAGSPSLTIQPVVDSVSGLSSASPISEGIKIEDGDGTAGKIYSVPIPMGSVNAKEKFVGLKYTPSSTQFTAGNVSAWLTKAP